jgi:hypothetical protein
VIVAQFAAGTSAFCPLLSPLPTNPPPAHRLGAANRATIARRSGTAGPGRSPAMPAAARFRGGRRTDATARPINFDHGLI